MRRVLARIVFLALVQLLGAASLARGEVQTVLDSGKPGPTLIIVDRPIENDVSGSSAIKQIGCWRLDRGKVLAVRDPAELSAASVSAPTVAVFFEVKKSGKSTEGASSLAARAGEFTGLLPKLNALLEPGTIPLTASAAPPTMSMPAAVSSSVAISIVSTPKGITLAERIRLFRHAVHELLVAQQMTSGSPWTLIQPDSKKIKAAVYAGGGTSINKNLHGYPACLDQAAGEIDYTYVGPMELAHPGMLDAFDVLIVGGGGASSEATAIGPDGANAIRAFIKKGGGFVSSCAGSYLATCGYPWSLKIIAADTIDPNHWARGSGQVNIELTDEGRSILGDLKELQSCRYANGPLLGPAANTSGLAPYRVLAYFRSDMATGKNVPKGIMPNTPAIIVGECGQGRVLCCSPHPEYTLALKSMIPRAVKWAAKRPVD